MKVALFAAALLGLVGCNENVTARPGPPSMSQEGSPEPRTALPPAVNFNSWDTTPASNGPAYPNTGEGTYNSGGGLADPYASDNGKTGAASR